jgi:diguanylate cyclase (GGDEF)-like protein
MIDLDNFKMVNDTFGHHQGDIVLRQVADQFTQMKRRKDMVGRWGGDEFVFILEEIDSVGDAIAFAQRLYREVRIFIEGENSAVLVTLSIGGSVFPNDRNNIEMALKEADDALYRAKAGGKEHISFCDHPAFVGVEDASLPTSE